jgi:DNA-binding HxlR family transcriptional regulator
VSAAPDLRVLAGSEPTDRDMIEGTNAAVALFSAKWKVDLLFLLGAGVRRHARLGDHLLVSKNVLSDALKSLERDGLVRRRVFDETPIRVKYSLTPLGRSLTVPLFAIWEWSDAGPRGTGSLRRPRRPRTGAQRRPSTLLCSVPGPQ